MLDDVGHVDLVAVDAGVGERLVEELPGRPDERAARLVLLVAGLLADEHRLRARGALAEDDLRPGLPELAGLAAGRFLRSFGRLRWSWRLSWRAMAGIYPCECESCRGRSGDSIAENDRTTREATMRAAAPWPSG